MYCVQLPVSLPAGYQLSAAEIQLLTQQLQQQAQQVQSSFSSSPSSSLPRPQYIGGRGIVFSRFLCIFLFFFLCLYLCFFVSKITRKRLDRFAWNFQGRCGVTVGRPDSILGQIGETARCRDADFFYIICQHYEQTAGSFAWNFQGRRGVTMGWPDYIFGQFRETARCHDAQHGDGVCCAFAPQLVYWLYPPSKRSEHWHI